MKGTIAIRVCTAVRSNMPVNTDAHEHPLPSVALVRGRRLRSRYLAFEAQ
jgi:hypothetical protein